MLLLGPAPLLLGGRLIGGADERSDIFIFIVYKSGSPFICASISLQLSTNGVASS